jgi:hypothetical protein
MVLRGKKKYHQDLKLDCRSLPSSKSLEAKWTQTHTLPILLLQVYLSLSTFQTILCLQNQLLSQLDLPLRSQHKQWKTIKRRRNSHLSTKKIKWKTPQHLWPLQNSLLILLSCHRKKETPLKKVRKGCKKMQRLRKALIWKNNKTFYPHFWIMSPLQLTVIYIVQQDLNKRS